MRQYFAPMEGITGYVFRNAHRVFYGGVQRYFAPFLAPGASHSLSTREKMDILPENNRGLCLVPQILTNQAEDFLWAARLLDDYGYGEVNLNLGCPSGTVTAKKKGAGFLACPAELDRFLETVFAGTESACPGMKISVKTRVGMESPEEFPALLEIFNRYPICELTIHPRIRGDFYDGPIREELFWMALSGSRAPVCWSGDLFGVERIKELEKEWERRIVAGESGGGEGDTMAARAHGGGKCDTSVARAHDGRKCDTTAARVHSGGEGDTTAAGMYGGGGSDRAAAVMLGRGAVASPWLFEEIAGESETPGDPGRFRQFHDCLLEGYCRVMSGDRNVLFKMKELWFYFGCHFPGGRKELKRIRKAQKLADYRAAVDGLFEGGFFDAGICWPGEREEK